MTEDSPLVNIIQNQQGVIVKTLEDVTQCLQGLESTMQNLPSLETSKSPNQYQGQRNSGQPVVCHKCKQEGHLPDGVLITVFHHRETRFFPCHWPGMAGRD